LRTRLAFRFSDLPMATRAARGANGMQHGAVMLVLLGTPRLELPDGGTVPLERLMAALLAKLAIDGPVPRAAAARLLWPDADDKGARNNLRQRLFRLRQVAQRDVVVPEVTLALAAGIAHDLADLGARLEEDPEAAAGELLGNLSFDDCLDLADWVTVAREQWAVARRNALAGVAAKLEAEGQIARALLYGERLVADDPLLEHAHRRVMRLHYLRGDRAAALTAFERCRDVLKRELKASPGPETLELARTIEASSAPTLAAPATRPVAVLHPPRLVGRKREWEATEQAWSEGRVVVVAGEPGIGKTRLASDFAGAHEGTALFGARPGDARIPYATTARIIRGLAQRFGMPTEEWVSGELARLAPELGPVASSKLETLRLFQALAAALDAWRKSGLTALAVDDAQFADDATLECLTWLLLQETGRSLHWLVGVRSGEVPAQFAKWRAEFAPDEARWLELEPLNEGAVAELLESLAIPDLDPQDWARPLARHTGGNPMFILETLLAMLAGKTAGMPRHDMKLPAPAHIGQLIERRLNQLSAQALRLARVAALAGQDFSAALAAQVLGVHLLDIAEPWRELELAQVIRDQGFAHDLIFEATLRSVPAPIARALHKDIAAHLAVQDAAPAAIARHWYEAEEWGRAAGAYVAAAEAARHASRRVEEVAYWRSAAECFDRAGEPERGFDARCASVEPVILVNGVERAQEVVEGLALDARGPQQRVAALNARALTRLMAADHVAGVAAAREAHAIAGGLESPWPRFEAARLLAVGLSQDDRAAEALPLIEPFRDLVEHEGTREQRGKFWADYSYVLNSARLLRRTAEALTKSIDNAREVGDIAELATQTSNLALVQGNLGQIDAALELAERARALRAQLGETGGPAGAAIDMYVGMYSAMIGRYRDALASLDAARACFEADGSEVWVAVANNHRTGILLDLGQFARARQTLGRASPKFESVRARIAILAGRIERALGGSGATHFVEALATLGERGDIYMRMLAQIDFASTLPAADAAAQCADVQRVAAEAEYHGIAAKAGLMRARYLLKAGEPGIAAATLRDRPAHLDGVRPADLYPAEAEWIAYEVFAAVDDRSAAKSALQHAVDWIEHAALPNVPEEFRDSFLSRNPVNRSILTTASRQRTA
jgi:DNA-binding SARP family transcriptional activator/tetratricopeptide (TPR) repeat protein